MSQSELHQHTCSVISAPSRKAFFGALTDMRWSTDDTTLPPCLSQAATSRFGRLTTTMTMPSDASSFNGISTNRVDSYVHYYSSIQVYFRQSQHNIDKKLDKNYIKELAGTLAYAT